MLILDFVPEPEQSQVRSYLDQAVQTTKNDTPHEQTCTFRGVDGQSIPVQLQACKTLFDGEVAVELQLQTAEDLTLAKRVRRLPWHLYFSFVCLALIITIPNLLLPNLNINNTPSTFLPPDAPSIVADKKVRETFPDDEVIVLLFEGVALFSDGFLRAYHALTESLEEHPLIDDVVSISRQDHISASENGFLVAPLINIEELAETSPKERLAKAVGDRFAKNSLVASDGSAIAMVVIPQALNNSIKHLALEEDVLALVRQHRINGYLTAMAGEISTDVAQMRIIQRDNMIFIPATVIAGLLLIWLLFRRVIAVVTTGVATSAVVGSTLAFYVVFEQPFNSISGIIPPLLSALTIATLIHFYNALHYASMRGLSGKRRVDSALREVKRPALFSALTTSAGLASLGLSPIPPIKVFGLTAAAGVFVIYFIVIHLLPPIFARFDRQEWPNRKSGLLLIDKLVRGLFHIGIRQPVVVLVMFVLLLGAGVPYILKVDVETDVQAFFHPGHKLRKATEHIQQKLVGTMPLEIILTSAEPEELIQPEVLIYIRELQTWLEQQPEVDKTVSIADFVEEMHWGFNAENPTFRAIPDNPELISQYLFVYDGEDLYDFIDEEYSIARIPLNLNVHGANEIGEVMLRIRQQLQETLPANISWDTAGAARMFSDQEDLLIKGQVYSLGGALLLIFVLMLALWRSLKDALICMIPNLSPVLLIFILMGIMSIWLDMATAMIASVAVGIAIDDTIHIYHGFIHRVRRGTNPVMAMARTYRQAGRAVMTTTIILCSQFVLMLASAFVPMNSFGLLTSTGLLAALVFDLLLLPALLILVFRAKSSNTPAHSQAAA
ncbi:MAG: MMPL family transporter [Pseudomonadales bacterium]|nr:MMPL family transporter [Pseudomonadales bacterium]MCP5172646.1 MMPL family transporter [Pseudomonadales bacterium]MCP5302120.1 MMPL family transporter [Pseudomonadales bacterium]